MDNCLITVVIPVYNCEAYLCQCLDSLLSQTYKALEIILVDDGATDTSPDICDMYEAEKLVVKVIHKINGGAAAARKTGLEQASGKYVLFVDADDWVEPNYVERLLSDAKAQNADVVLGTFRCYAEGNYTDYNHLLPAGFYNRQRCEKEIFPVMLSSNPFYSFGVSPSMCGKLFRTEIAKKNLQALDTGIIFGEDGCFTYSALLDCESIAITDANGYIYRQNSASATHRFNEKLLPDGKKLKAFLENLAKEKNWNVNSQIDEYMAYVCNYTVTRAMKAGYTDTREGKKQLKTYIKSLFPQGLLKNSRFQKCSRKMKVRFWLISHCFFNILKKLI